MDNYYVYIYLDQRKKSKESYGDYYFEYEPFYVGKGRDNGSSLLSGRSHSHLREAKTGNTHNQFKINVIRLIQETCDGDPIIMKVDECMSEERAFRLEEELINIIGRRNLGDGPLTNLTDGGGGGTSGWIPSSEWREKQSKYWKKFWSDPTNGHKMARAVIASHTTDVNERRSESLKQYYIDHPEARIQLREIQKVIQNKPEVKKKNSDGVRRSWENVEIRQKRLDGLNKVVSTDEYKDKQRKITLKRYENKEERTKQSNYMKDRWKDPEFKKRMLDARKKKKLEKKLREKND